MSDEPRLAPLPESSWDDRQRAVLEPLLVGPTRNIYTTIVRAPDLAEAMTTLGRTLRGGTLSLRHRETLILRTGWNCDSAYERAQHERVARYGGMTEDDLARIAAGPGADGWDPVELVLCRLADELHAGTAVSDETWAALSAAYDETDCILAVMLVGYYHLVSQVLNALRVPIEDDVSG